MKTMTRNDAPKAAHTPTPWSVKSELTRSASNEVVDADGLTVAECPRYGAGIVSDGRTAPWHHANANAAFIVRAVNCHEDLVRACDAFLAKCPTSNPDGSSNLPMIESVRRIIRDAKGEA
jgi:hypothetical protein